MWTTLALAAAVSVAPAQAGSLELTNVRATYGVLGAPRPDMKFLPGDQLILAFEISGIKTDDNGNASYSMGMEVSSEGKVKFKQDPEKVQATNFFGGNKLPALAHVEIGLDQPAGKYNVKITVTDLGVKDGKPAVLSKDFEILPPGLGIVRVGMGDDPRGGAAPDLGVVGQLTTLNAVIVGFGRTADKKPQPDLKIEMRILDEKGNPTLKNPIADTIPNKNVPEIPANQKAIDLHFTLPLTRAGTYTIELKVTDKTSKGQPVVLKLPLTVVAQGK